MTFKKYVRIGLTAIILAGGFFLTALGGNANRYAVLMNGDASSFESELHEYNISHAYKTLKALNVNESNIFILSHNNPRPESTSKNSGIINAEFTRKNLDSVVNRLSVIVDSDDIVIFYGTGHGERLNNQSFLDLYEDSLLSESEFKRSVEKINSGVTVVVMDQCYSGGFAEALKNSSRNVIAMSETDSKHGTCCQYFSEEFWNAPLDSTADTNHDGRVSVKEAYDKAIAKHKELSSNKITDGKYVCSKNKKDAFLK